MSKVIVKENEFEKLRLAYQTVKEFLEDFSGAKVKSLDSNIELDLSLWGDDNLEMLERFTKNFELEYEGFEYDKHFLSEGELFSGGINLENLLRVSIWLPLKIVEKISFDRLNLSSESIKPKPDTKREVIGMTFKDLITWYVEGKYSMSNEVVYKIENVT